MRFILCPVVPLLAIWIALHARQCQGVETFEQEVAPILVKRCLECHNARDKKGGLDLSSHTATTLGGDSGKAIIAGQPQDSPLLDRVANGEMPPPLKGQPRPLSKAEVSALRAWVQAGAAWPKDRQLDIYERTTDVRGGLDWWALQPVKRPAVPIPQNAAGVANPIDTFIQSKLDTQNMVPAPPADRRTLIRRAYFDLWGLPPTFEEVEAFAGANDPLAYEQLIDHLLDSKHYGERWARYWLDLVRFAETCGYERDQLKPKIWQYRDWVIDAFNDDLPYDRFVTDQLAGDEVPWRDEKSVTATGMLRAGTWNDEPNDPADYLYERLEDMIHVTSSAFLGLTVKCARCHDHKFDPIRQTDYYRIASFFWAGYIGQSNLGGPSTKQLGFDVFGWTDRSASPDPIRLLIKGERDRPGPVVAPGFLSAVPQLDKRLSPPPNGSKTSTRRLQFARWITDERNPLTARVIVNRLWQHHFGQAIVRTPNNFGFKSSPPTHPRLLDWLAADFVAGGWKLKRIHKLIMTSKTYRQSSLHPKQSAYAERDFLNRHWWRQNRRRLDAEALRDSMLAVSGQLNKKMGGPSFFPRMSKEALEGLSRKGKTWGNSSARERARRSVYMMTKRSRLLPLMTTFDFSDTTLPCGQRDVTTVAPQALALLNNHFVHEQGQAFAREVLTVAGKDPQRQIAEIWQRALGRKPSPVEIRAAEHHLGEQQAHFTKTMATDSPSGGVTKLPVTNELELWLRADRGVSTTQDGAVIAWMDHSDGKRRDAHIHHASQADPRHRPQLVKRGLQGQPVIRFDGQARFLNLAGQVLWSPQFTILAVARDERGNGHRAILSNWHSRNGNSTTSVFLGLTATNTIRFTDAFANAGEITPRNKPFLLSATSRATEASVAVNGKQIAVSSSALSSRVLNSPFVIGTQGNIRGEYWHGDIAELLVYDRALSKEEHDQVSDYLATRYGIPLARRAADPQLLALASLCHVVLNTNEFIFVD